MIDRKRFNESFQYFDNDVIIEVIDVFLNEFEERLNKLHTAITENDLPEIIFQAHSFKGVFGTFCAAEPFELSSKIEELAKNNISAGLPELFTRLHTATFELAKELREIKNEFPSLSS